jgi:uncharacterized protein
MATICITGGTGLVGKHLTKILVAKGHRVIVLSRKKNPAGNNVSYAVWNLQTGEIDRDAIANSDYIIHLAGAGVAEKRWSKRRKEEIVNSRTQSSALLVKALQETPNKIKAVISASAIGWYGPDASAESKSFIETDVVYNDFLGQTCLAWEQSIDPVTQLGIRLVKFRIGIVLSNDGGALREFKKPLHFGLAAILGPGTQIVSWVHIDDLCRMFLFATEQETMNLLKR